MTSADVYARISDDREGLRKGVDRRQIPLCVEYCERAGITIDHQHVDNDITAFRKKGRRPPRPAYDDLYARIKTGTVTTIVAYHLDRLYRDARELEDLIDLVEATQVRIRTVTGGDFDLNTSDGRAMARVVVAFNMKESEDKSRRIRDKHIELAREGRRPGGGTRQFGFTDPHTLDPAEAELLREAARRVLAGETVRAVCNDWNRQGVPTVTGKAWTQTVLRRSLTAPSTAGLREHHGAITKAEWPTILDEATHRRLRLVLLDPARRTNVIARRYLLTGLIRCGRADCGARMVARPRANKKRGYVCATGPGFSGCGHTYTLAEPVEAEVAAQLFAVVDATTLARAVADNEEGLAESVLLEGVAALEAKLAELAAMWAAGAIESGEWIAARQGIEHRLAVARRQLVRSVEDERVRHWAGRGGDLEAWWRAESTTLAQRRAVLSTWVESVTIGERTLPAGSTRFDADRIAITWRL